jgi:hypothetical protein
MEIRIQSLIDDGFAREGTDVICDENTVFQKGKDWDAE